MTDIELLRKLARLLSSSTEDSLPSLAGIRNAGKAISEACDRMEASAHTDVLAERERCAKVLDGLAAAERADVGDGARVAAAAFEAGAAAIRAQ
jgi:hypothetical protein